MYTSVHDWTPDSEPTYRPVMDRLSAAGVDLERVEMTPDCVFWLTVPAGRIAFGADDSDTGGDWWSATAIYDDGSEVVVFEGHDLTALASELATR